MDERPTYLAEPDPVIERRRRKTALIALLVAFAVFLAAVVVSSSWYRGCRRTPEADGSTVSLTVAEGATGHDVVRDLADQGLIRCGGLIGEMLLRATGKASAIRAGTYDIAMGTSLADIVDTITTAPKSVPTVRVTVPEGLRIRSTFPRERTISSVIEEETGISADAFADYVETADLSLPPYLPSGRNPEGFLFPDTYQFVKKGLTPQVIADRMLEQFKIEADDLHLSAGARALEMSPYEVVVVASMIEREAQVDKDRAVIAGVIYNRLAAGMTLGIDATLLYDDPTPDGKLSTADLAADTPYNTRINAGLPPTPIASPGRASLEAALHPAQTDYLYYVLCPPDGEGVHRFAVTYQEHLANVQACLGN